MAHQARFFAFHLPLTDYYAPISRGAHGIRYPNLVVQDLAGHVSQIDPSREGQHNFTWRANIHRWEPISRYCDPLTGAKLEHTRK